MNDLILSWIRTAVPAAVGSLIAWLATKGLTLDPAEATGLILAVGGVCVTLYQVVVSTLQRRWPIIGVLLGSTRVPTYQATARGTHSDRPLHTL
ncbi:hypothetical protein [Streptosporangium sp. NPDC049376]|uniref:hypothetical protein n=1 Tax=Streptosporangium sp. NPDC049376 TaxID=3366192 RepID=UPI00378D3BA6